jgi:hypothetical protein
MKQDVAGCKVNSKVKRTLIFHNALMVELQAKNLNQRRSLCQIITGKVLRKYRVIDMVNQFGCTPKLIERQQARRKNTYKWNALNGDLVKKVHNFYLREDNSRSTSGKKIQ